VNVGAAEMPSMIDEIPILACLAARADGETVISGAAELRVKESDRISAVVRNLQAIGVDAEERPDGMAIRGSLAPLSGRIETHGDHRIAMAFGVLGALPDNEIDIVGPECVSVSYPSFWSDLRRVA
jgi:3-phosphoshikimate 1-carboxyvinyltransferase